MRSLESLARSAVNAQVYEHNHPNAPDSSRHLRAFEKAALAEGYVKVIWPGLNPVAIDDKGKHHTYW